MWMRVENTEGKAAYVDLRRVVKIEFRVNAQAKQFDAAFLYAIGGEGLVMLGSVTGDVSLRKLEEYVTSDNSGKEFVFA